MNYPISVDSRILFPALKRACKHCVINSENKFMAWVRIDPLDGLICITSVNPVFTFSATIPAVSKKSDSFCVDANIFKKIIEQTSSLIFMTYDKEGNELFITSDNAVFTLNCKKSGEFISLRDQYAGWISGARTILTPAESLVQSAKRLKEFTHNGRELSELFGLHGVKFSNDFAVASDGIQMGKVEGNPALFNGIIPVETCRAIAGLSEIKNATFAYNSELLYFCYYGSNFSKFEIVSELIDGKYPAFESVFSYPSLFEIKTNTYELQKNLNYFTPYFKNSGANIRFQITKNCLTIKKNCEGIGSVRTEQYSKRSDERSFKISFNGELLLKYLNSVKSENLTIQFTGEYSPARFKGEDDPLHFVLMPLAQ